MSEALSSAPRGAPVARSGSPGRLASSRPSRASRRGGGVKG